VQTEYLAHIVEEFWFLIFRCVSHIICPCWCSEIADNRHRAKLPESSAYISLSGQDVKLINGSAEWYETKGRIIDMSSMNPV